MKNKDWECKVLLQKDNNFIEHVLEGYREEDEEDKMIDYLDGIDNSEVKWEKKELLIEEAAIIVSLLNPSSQIVLSSFIKCGKFDEMARDLECSTSTAWKKLQKVYKEIEEIKDGRRNRETL
jgi:DNA-directed RNA polymerase specialized sigma24 family protein